MTYRPSWSAAVDPREVALATTSAESNLSASIVTALSYSLAANTLAAGSILRFKGHGYVTGSPGDVIAMLVKFNGVQKAGVAMGLTLAASLRGFTFDAAINVLSVGPTAGLNHGVEIRLGEPPAAIEIASYNSGVTIDTTVPLTVALTFQGNNSMTGKILSASLRQER